MSYGYDEPLVGYPLLEFAQPPHKIIPHLDTAQEQEEMMREEEREEMEWASGIGPNNTMGIEGNDWAIGQASPPPLEHNGHPHNTPFHHDMYPHPYDYSTGAEAKTDLTEPKLEGDGIVPQITQTLDPAPLWI